MSGLCINEIIGMLDWQKLALLPTIAQDSSTHAVLMLAFMDKQALRLTLETGYMHYFSRSKNRIWKKGEVSGHTQRVESLSIDCDGDALLFMVKQEGAACHTGEKSCFFHTFKYPSQALSAHNTHKATSISQATSSTFMLDSSNTPNATSSLDAHNNASLHNMYGVIDVLYHTLLARKNAQASSSYTASLYARGVNGFGKKIIEEAGEVLLALKDKNKADIIHECADLLYHTLVGLAYYNIHPERISIELARRFHISGLEEKAMRSIAK